MNFEVILAYAFGLLILYIIGMLLVVPLKWIGKLIINGILGGVALFLINIIGNFVGFSIAINPINAIITGILGLPGVALILILQKIL
ncbi:pro-sigmaK processing inhibitor BofA family protein [Sporanaerobacter sp.]|uniref:pro-sigmaK processing inhibitor BofA family protein n=1 Tax=Sporanaerobacter sp. TaxID=2010183 RepID=UPI003A1029EA